MKSGTLAERLWPRVDKSAGDAGCWPWTGSRLGNGYGQISKGQRRCTTTSRAAYELTYGPIPEGMYVCHTCDNPPCCNPAHLWLGTARANAHDMVDKGRSTKGRPVNQGAAHGGASLTDDDVAELRQLFARGAKAHRLAARFGISRQHVYKVANGESWGHVEGAP